ncbi:MAG: phage tail-type lysozyme domain-containing protein [Streptococcaceae bacterium]|jgi:hypothetical protein|nr:phage tail-type lysozyme domain-containing protein [Streptococcaceae bacterium]
MAESDLSDRLTQRNDDKLKETVRQEHSANSFEKPVKSRAHYVVDKKSMSNRARVRAESLRASNPIEVKAAKKPTWRDIGKASLKTTGKGIKVTGKGLALNAEESLKDSFHNVLFDGDENADMLKDIAEKPKEYWDNAQTAYKGSKKVFTTSRDVIRWGAQKLGFGTGVGAAAADTAGTVGTAGTVTTGAAGTGTAGTATAGAAIAGTSGTAGSAAGTVAGVGIGVPVAIITAIIALVLSVVVAFTSIIPSVSASTSSTPPVNGDSLTRAMQMYNYLKAKGGTINGISALLGNSQVETGSTFDPSIIQGGAAYNQSEAMNPSAGGYAFGLFQWDSGRRVNLINYATSTNNGWDDMDTQLDFAMNQEGSDSSIFQSVMKTNSDAESAARTFNSDWERSADTSDMRANYAEAWYLYLSGQGGSSDDVATAKQLLGDFHYQSPPDSAYLGWTSVGSVDKNAGLDCSSFVWLVLKLSGDKVDNGGWYTVSMLSSPNLTPISADQAQAGDICVVGGTSGGGAAGHTFILEGTYRDNGSTTDVTQNTTKVIQESGGESVNESTINYAVGTDYQRGIAFFRPQKAK